jgi:uncharacterized membrane protein
MAILFTNSVKAAKYEVSNYTIDATILENGNMHVVEYLKYNFDDDMNGVFRDILYKYTYSNQKNDMRPASSWYQADSVQNLKVYTSDNGFTDMKEAILKDESLLENGMSGVYSAQKYGNGEYREKIKVYTPVKSGNNKYVKYEYDLTNVVVTYNDANEIYWNFLGGDWQCYINNLKVNINWSESFDIDKIHAYPHSYANVSKAEIAENSIAFTASGISESTAVDARIVLPKGNINNILKHINSNYNYDELTVIEKEAEQGKEKHVLSMKVFVGIAAFAFASLIYIIVIAVKNSSKGKKTGNNLDYYREIPSTYHLGEYSLLINRNVGFMDSNLVLATIMDLSERGYLKLEPKKKAKKIFFTDAEYDYDVILNAQKGTEDLDDYEKKLLKLLFNGKNNKDSDSIEYNDPKIELNSRFKELAKDYSKMAKNRKELYNMNNEYKDLFYEKTPKKLIDTGMLLNVIVVISLLVNIFAISPLNNKAGMIAISLIFYGIYMVFTIAAVYSSRSIKEIHLQGYNELMGLKKYLKDYSVIKQRYPIEIALWGKYLVFATLFGIADKVSKEFKEELLKQGYDEDYVYTNFAIINMSMHYTQISTTMASYTGSSSSGGYAGGGSGGGGGGGRRRWRILGTNKLIGE